MHPTTTHFIYEEFKPYLSKINWLVIISSDFSGSIDRSPLPESLRDASTGLDFIEPTHTYVYEGR